MSKSETEAWIDGKRITKAWKIVRFLEGAGFDVIDVAGFEDGAWKMAAAGAGVQSKTVPSPKTQKYVLGFMNPINS